MTNNTARCIVSPMSKIFSCKGWQDCELNGEGDVVSTLIEKCIAQKIIAWTALVLMAIIIHQVVIYIKFLKVDF